MGTTIESDSQDEVGNIFFELRGEAAAEGCAAKMHRHDAMIA